jgi:hypothetical protein
MDFLLSRATYHPFTRGEPAYRQHLGRRGTPPLLRLPRWRTTKLSAPPATSRLLHTRRPHPETLANILRNPRRTTTPPRNNASTHNPPQSAPPNPPPCDGRRASLCTRPNPALQAHEKSSTRHAKGIFTMDEIRAAIILDQHLASTIPEAQTRRPTLAHTWPLHPLSLDTRSMLGI